MQVKAVQRAQSAPSRRRTIFRTIRLLLAAAVLGGIGYFGWRAFTVVVAEQAYINADIVTVRAAIDGELEMAGLKPGALVDEGAPLFRITNPRFANTEAASELSRLQELVERLRLESEEADVRLAQFEEHARHAAGLQREKLLPPLQVLEETSKVAVAKTVAVRKREQLELAEARCRMMERNVALLKESSIAAPFSGAVWSTPMQAGNQVQANETVMQLIDPKRVWVEAYLPERHAKKFSVGMDVKVRLLDGGEILRGRVEALRGGVGRIPHGSGSVTAPGEFTHRRIAVRVSMLSPNPFSAEEFFGVGRSITLEL